MSIKKYWNVFFVGFIYSQIGASQFVVQLEDETSAPPVSTFKRAVLKESVLAEPAIGEMPLSSQSATTLSGDTTKNVAILAAAAVGTAVALYGVKKGVDYLRSSSKTGFIRSDQMSTLAGQESDGEIVCQAPWFKDFKKICLEALMAFPHQKRLEMCQHYCQQAQYDPFVLINDKDFMQGLTPPLKSQFKDVLVLFALEFSDRFLNELLRDDQKDILAHARDNPEKLLEKQLFSQFDTDQQQKIRQLFATMHNYRDLINQM